jgi:hypothetical protein
MRLNGWQRIGVLLSILWFIVGGLWINSTVIEDLGAPVVAKHLRCLDARSVQPDGTVPKDTDWGPCQAAFNREYPPAIADHWYWAIAFTLIPIPTVWLLVYGLLALMRWIMAGFASSKP